MNRLFSFILLLSAVTLIGCIGDDFILDTVDEQLRITTVPDTLAIGDAFQCQARYTNNIGIEEEVQVTWSSSNPQVASIDPQGLLTGVSEGPVSISAEVQLIDTTLTTSATLFVADTTIISEPGSRTGTARSTSSYVLEGSFELSQEGDSLTLALASDWRASSNLPGLYVYLTNNPNSTNGAFEIGPVMVFEGEHAYTFPGSQASLNQYSHVLYYCKPFNVKVGDGPFDN